MGPGPRSLSLGSPTALSRCGDHAHLTWAAGRPGWGLGPLGVPAAASAVHLRETALGRGLRAGSAGEQRAGSGGGRGGGGGEGSDREEGLDGEGSGPLYHRHVVGVLRRHGDSGSTGHAVGTCWNVHSSPDQPCVQGSQRRGLCPVTSGGAGGPTVELQPDVPDAPLLRLLVQHREMLVVGGHHADVGLRHGWGAGAG